MFALKTGVGFEGVLAYYGEKSFDGLLELSYPHLGGMGLYTMVLGHFFLFTALRKRVRALFVLLFVLAFLTIAAPYAVLAGLKLGAVVKVASVVGLILLASFFSLRLWIYAQAD